MQTEPASGVLKFNKREPWPEVRSTGAAGAGAWAHGTPGCFQSIGHSSDAPMTRVHRDPARLIRYSRPELLIPAGFLLGPVELRALSLRLGSRV